MTADPRPLWEHPEPDMLMPDDGEEFETWAELRDNVREYLGALNVPYVWEWRQPEDAARDTFHIGVILTRKARTVEWWCPIDRADEPDARALLATCAAYLHTAGSPACFGKAAPDA